MPFAELVLPAIRWDDKQGFAPAKPEIERALAAGVGGFIVFGGERAALQSLTRDLRSAARRPLLIASDLERGAGQQVSGLTPLPPALALAHLGVDAVREAARLTAREARDVGINWALAPVCDLDIEPRNPIVQTRSFGPDAFDVAAMAEAWIEVCQGEGVMACAKHFPGHGRTVTDSHAELPVVSAGRELERDLMPFRRAVAGGVASVMTAHVAFPAWDASQAAATFSRALLVEALRRDLFFGGLTVTDALIMEGALAQGSAGDAAVRAVLGGCDLVLYPPDLDPVIKALREAAEEDRGGFADLAARAALRREEAVARTAEPRQLGDAELAAHRRKAQDLSTRSVKLLRGDPPRLKLGVNVEVVDDDAGGPYPVPPRTEFAAELERLGLDVSPRGETVVALFSDVKSWKGRAELSRQTVERLGALLKPTTPVVLFGHPRRQIEIPHLGPVLCAWSGDEGMQRAAARRVAGAAS